VRESWAGATSKWNYMTDYNNFMGFLVRGGVEWQNMSAKC